MDIWKVEKNVVLSIEPKWTKWTISSLLSHEDRIRRIQPEVDKNLTKTRKSYTSVDLISCLLFNLRQHGVTLKPVIMVKLILTKSVGMVVV